MTYTTSGKTSHLDTVAYAVDDPDAAQPYAELGLTPDEYANIREILGRRPTSAELAMYSVMWSEHCSYKSSKVHFRHFAENTTEEMKEKLLVGGRPPVSAASSATSCQWARGRSP